MFLSGFSENGVFPMNMQKAAFSEEFYDALLKADMIREMAIEDGWGTLEECMERAPEALDIFLRHAEAALRAVRRMENANLECADDKAVV
jgi:hypothetical protein